MPYDLMVPFAILILLVIYLIYSRQMYEKEVVEVYEEKFEQWKKHSSHDKSEKIVCKELVGLVFKEDLSVTVELLDNDIAHRLQRGKFSIKGQG